MNEALVAIVGEPNVGKSTILNKIVAERMALTSTVAGTTRDRFYATTTWNGIDFTLVDTAGIILEQRDELEKNVQKQVKIALAQADFIIYVVDGKKNPESINRAILNDLRKNKKDILLAINKLDSPKAHDPAVASYKFTGIKKIFPISAVSGIGFGDMLDAVTETLEKKGFSQNVKDPAEISVSLVGKPNVGKSSMFNKIIGEERVVVSNVPGTTRNVIDTIVEYKGRKIKFLDTAGLKKKEKRAPVPDIYAAFQTLRAINKADISILVIDSTEPITSQDPRIASEIVEAGKGLIVVANKIDKLTDKEKFKLEKQLSDYFEFLWWAPAVPVSAKTGEGIKEVLNYILTIKENRFKEIDPETLTQFFKEKLKQRQPQRIRDERVPKVFSLTQLATNPPLFTMTVNEPSAISKQFRKFIQNSIIKELDFWGTPVLLKLKAKSGNPNSKAIE